MAEGNDSIFDHPWLQGHQYMYLPTSVYPEAVLHKVPSVVPPLLLGLLAIPQLTSTSDLTTASHSSDPTKASHSSDPTTASHFSTPVSPRNLFC